MICLVLAGGFAVRMHPLTENTPKALLCINKKTILSYIMEDLCKNPELEKIILLTNNKFYSLFEQWIEASDLPKEIILFNNGMNRPEENCGVIESVVQVIQTFDVTDDFLIIGGDNLLSFPIRRFLDFYYESRQSCVMWYQEDELERLQRTGVAVVKKDKVEKMQEKPQVPIGNCAIPPIYIYSAEAIKQINECLNSECKTNSPGDLLEWLVSRTTIRAMKMPGCRYDVGNLQNYYQLENDSTKHYYI